MASVYRTPPSPARPSSPRRAIHAPGKRLLASTGYRFLRRRTRPVRASIDMSALRIVLVPVALVLLPQFYASGEVCLCTDLPVHVPFATHVEEMIDAPMVQVTRGMIHVGARVAEPVRDVLRAGVVVDLPQLRAILADERELWMSQPSDQPLCDTIVLSIDQHTPAVVVKSVIRAAAASGFPHLSFKVNPLSPGAVR
jgi:hypothetical protein